MIVMQNFHFFRIQSRLFPPSLVRAKKQQQSFNLHRPTQASSSLLLQVSIPTHVHIPVDLCMSLQDY